MIMRLTIKGDPDLSALAQIRNDGFRSELTGGIVHLSAGIVALGAGNQRRIVEAVRQFDDFDDDDEFNAHDIGDLEVELSPCWDWATEGPCDGPDIPTWRELIFFRIDEIIAPDTAAPVPVLTVMLASEW